MKKHVKIALILAVVNMFLIGLCGCGNAIDNDSTAEMDKAYANEPLIKVIYDNPDDGLNVATNNDSVGGIDANADLESGFINSNENHIESNQSLYAADEPSEYESSEYETPQLADRGNVESASEANTDTISEQSLNVASEPSEYESSTYEIPQSTYVANSGNGSNFNIYDNEEQQQTAARYVLNTNTMKVHFPKCNDVKKISSENYSTSNESFAYLQAQGYTSCGHCNAR